MSSKVTLRTLINLFDTDLIAFLVSRGTQPEPRRASNRLPPVELPPQVALLMKYTYTIQSSNGLID